MPRPRNTKPKSYGRQDKDKTIKSLSLDDDVVECVQKEADRRGIKFSPLVNGILKGEIRIELPLKMKRSN